MELNSRQKEAVRYIDGPLLVLAGAGSGKTRVITYKIFHLIDRCGIAPEHIAAVTFTNKAAREMKERIGKLLGGRETRGLRVSTFHTFGLEILRREHHRLGYKPGFSILDAQDSEALIKDLAPRQRQDGSRSPSDSQWRISRWKNALLTPEEALSRAVDDQEADSARLYADYARTLRAYNALDFDDLIRLPVELFGADRDTLEEWRHRIRYLLVDEYQDTNSAQYELVKQLVGRHGRLTAVGDDDQSIYAWRGARPENLAQIREDFPSLRVVALEQNYRSSGRILRIANRLIAHNDHLFEKRLWSDLGPGEPARVLPCRDETHEAERVVSEILHLHHTKGRSFSEFAILYRGNHQARPFEQALRAHDIPYFLSGGTSFFDRAEVKDIMAYLRVLVNPADDAAFLRIVNTPRREIGTTSIEKLATYAQSRHTSLLRACPELGLQQFLGERQRGRLEEFSSWIERHARNAEGDSLGTVRQMIQEVDYRSWLRETSSNDRVAERRWANVTELLDWLGALQKGGLQETTLQEMLNHLTLMDALDRRGEEDGGQRVHLMTLHAAKGLEFPHVFLVGMEEELIPHRTSIEAGAIDEERRLAYVGITRAQRQLTFTLAERRRHGGELVRSEPSRFLDELRGEEIHWAGADNISIAERRERGSAHLSSLKGLLSGG